MNEHQRQLVVDFFGRHFSWWENLYTEHAQKNFFSYEMAYRKSLVVETVCRCLKGRSRGRVLECGCGPGGIMKALPCSEHTVFGLDINFHCLREIKHEETPLQLLCCDIEALPFASHHFDVVICAGVLSYLEQDDQALAEMTRLLKPGGYLILANPNLLMADKFLDPYYLLVWPFRQLVCRWRHKNNKQKNGTFETRNVRRYRYHQLDRLFSANCLQIRSCEPTSYGPLRFWRKNFLPLSGAIRLSKLLVSISKKDCRPLVRFANHWVFCLEKSVI